MGNRLFSDYRGRYGGHNLTDSWESQRGADTIRLPLRKGTISASELENLIGELCFSQTCLFGKFARKQIRCTYRQIRAEKYTADLSTPEKMAPRWLVGVIDNITPRIHRSAAHPTDFVLYTDASASANRISALLHNGNYKRPVALRLKESKAPRFRRNRFSRKNDISDWGRYPP